jgi:hypothetical protein
VLQEVERLRDEVSRERDSAERDATGSRS